MSHREAHRVSAVCPPSFPCTVATTVALGSTSDGKTHQAQPTWDATLLVIFPLPPLAFPGGSNTPSPDRQRWASSAQCHPTYNPSPWEVESGES